jgi:hypothetical protein
VRARAWFRVHVSVRAQVISIGNGPHGDDIIYIKKVGA